MQQEVQRQQQKETQLDDTETKSQLNNQVHTQQIEFSDEFNKAIEDKKIAEQGALKAKYDLERVTLEAKAQLEKQRTEQGC